MNKTAQDSAIFEVSPEQTRRAYLNLMEDMQANQAVMDEQRMATLNILEDINEAQKKIKEKDNLLLSRAEKMNIAFRNILEDSRTDMAIIAQAKVKDEALLQSIGEGVVAVDSDGKIILINRAAEQMLGQSAGQVMGKLIFEAWRLLDEKGNLVPEEKRPIAIALKGKTITTTTGPSYFYTAKDGTAFPVAITVTPVIINNKIIGAVDAFRDITKERSIDKAKTEFVSLASHQLRTPLSAVNWYAEMLLAGDAGRMKPEQAQYLEVIYHSNQRMIELVNSLLNVSRLELGNLAVESKLADITKIADRIINDLGHEMFKKKQTFEKKYDKNLKPMMLDEKLIGMIFQNLLSNAIKYTPEKGKIMLEIKIKGKMLEIAVADNGIGIPAAQQDKIFTKLFRADNVRVIDTEGTGLGLYLVKLIVERIDGGQVWFSSPGGSLPASGHGALGGESPKNPGSTFYVTLPIMS